MERLSYDDVDKRRYDLMRLRASGEIAAEDYNTNDLHWLIDMDQPLRTADLKNHALVMTREEFNEIDLFDVISHDGQRITLDPESFFGEVLIIFPHDLS